MAILYWELVFIRWLGSCIRIVAYFSNFVLIASFIGLGAGALLGRFKFRLEKGILYLLAFCILLGPFLGAYLHFNPVSTKEFIWFGNPEGILEYSLGYNFWSFLPQYILPFWLLLVIVFISVSLLFAFWGQYLAKLFSKFPPLMGYTIEISGSLAGILMFTLLSYFQASPLGWFLIGFILIISSKKWGLREGLLGALVYLLTLLIVHPYISFFHWSPYYKIEVHPIKRIWDIQKKQFVHLDKVKGYYLAVNNDYHQMILDLSHTQKEHPFFQEWQRLYDTPYQKAQELPQGPVLIVGAGTGNDVAAALRNTHRKIDIVEIDPKILQIGKELHPERPYSNPRVTIFNEDARNFFIHSPSSKYSLIVFGFLDSHTLFS
ncbi:MAG: hypothetical protein D6785_13275, partial [Planctomycetota bacterium]